MDELRAKDPPPWQQLLWMKIAAAFIVTVVTTIGAVVLERMGNLQTDIGTMNAAVQRISEIDAIQDRLLTLELSRIQTPHAQLSSSIDHFPELSGESVEMELVDSIHDIIFDPKRSASEVKIRDAGDYLVLAAPQVQRNGVGSACLDMWIKINKRDLRNSGVRHCWGENTPEIDTTVLVLQAMLSLIEGDVLEVVIRSDPEGVAGMVAIRTNDTPLVPSIIFSMLRVN